MILCVYCAGGLGKEVMDMAEEINLEESRWEEIVFIDDILDEKEFYGHNLFSFEEIKKHIPKKSIEVVIANGEPEVRRILFLKCRENDFPVATLIHPKADISPSAQIGAGAIIRKYSSVSSDVVIEDNVYIQSYVGIGHDVLVGANTVLSSFLSLPGSCKTGKCAYIAPGCIINNGVKIGDYAIVGMGAVVMRNVKSGKIVMGNPAKVIGENTDKTVFHRF